MGIDISIKKLKYVDVFEVGTTHNLIEMAEKAGLYQYIWKPEELNIKEAHELIDPLYRGLTLLKSKPDYFKQFEADNGWGTYEQFVSFVEKYLNGCIENPDGLIEANR
jgi:hypothetical protein